MGNWCYFTLLVGVITPFTTGSGAHPCTATLSASRTGVWRMNNLDLSPTQDASGKWRFRLGFLIPNHVTTMVRIASFHAPIQWIPHVRVEAKRLSKFHPLLWKSTKIHGFRSQYQENLRPAKCKTPGNFNEWNLKPCKVGGTKSHHLMFVGGPK